MTLRLYPWTYWKIVFYFIKKTTYFCDFFALYLKGQTVDVPKLSPFAAAVWSLRRYVLWGPVCENHWKNGNKQLIKRGFSMGFAVYSPLALIHAKWAYCSIDVVTYWLVTGISHHNCRADLWWLKVRTSYTHTNLTHLYTRAWSGVGVGETTAK